MYRVGWADALPRWKGKALEESRRRIAIIGAGISGLGAAWLLSRRHDVALFEMERRLGGYSRTIVLRDADGRDYVLDTGFIVFNEDSHPHLCGMFRHLGIVSKRSDMSFAVNVDNGAIEYGCRSFRSALAQGSKVWEPSFWRMFLDIRRFHRSARDVADDTPGLTVEMLISRLQMGDWFRNYYLPSMSGAIWSISPSQMLAFPATVLTRALSNQGLLSFPRHYLWRTVVGGSRSYVERMQAGMGAEVRSGARVEAVSREPNGVRVRAAGQDSERFDDAILACHSDAALRILKNAEPDEVRTLRAIRFRRSRAVVHCDPCQMPRRHACWSSRVYFTRTGKFDDAPKVTYWLNSLQGVPPQFQVFETLNPDESLREEHVLDEYVFAHPLFDLEFLAAQKRLSSIQGRGNIWYCGAWTGSGFHEDGLRSAVSVARRFGVEPPWPE